jgi:hypothetical protein
VVLLLASYALIGVAETGVRSLGRTRSNPV